MWEARMGFSISLMKMRMGWWALVGLLVLTETKGVLGCLEEEMTALLKLKASFRNDTLLLPSWNQKQQRDCCAWDGVICDKTTRRVIQLLLGSTNADTSGMTPSPWSLNASLLLPLKQLQVLDLSSNFLTDVSGIFDFNQLRFLDISFNKMETFSASIGELQSLRTFNLSDNSLSDPLLLQEVLCKLKNLEVLHLSGNNLFGYLPPCLGKLTSLLALDISNNNFRGIISSSLISSLTHIEYISLSNNHFEGVFSLSWLANFSKLEVFDLSGNNSHLTIETDNPPFFPQFQLKYFHVSWGTLNVIPSFLSHQYDLRVFDLSHNNITGRFPHWLLRNNKRLEYLNLRGNHLTEPLELHSTLHCPQMMFFDVSDNGFQGEIPLAIGSIFPNMFVMNMSKNAFQGQIPASIGNMRDLQELHLSFNSLSGEIPGKLLNSCRALSVLNLANNDLHGQILPAKSNLKSLNFLYLDNNHFSGEISRGLLNSPFLDVLDASNNSLSGKLPSWIGNMIFTYLVLSQNQLDGPIPLCQLETCLMVDLSQNNFNGILPHCSDNTPQWQYVKLQGNKLSGPMPKVLSKAASSLTLLDLMNNQLSGEIPDWISSLSNLRVLLLKGNRLEGAIPFSFCQLKNLTILDLAHNSLSGGIPSCFHNMAFGSSDGLDAISNGYYIESSGFFTSKIGSPIDVDHLLQQSEFVPDKEQVQFKTKFRLEVYKGITLRLMSGIDLSSNNLTGEIPLEIGYLGNIHALNLSNNLLSRSIPESFSNLKQIESLDLSHNNLSGHIPSQLIQLFSLSVFSVAYNNLSGSIPLMVNQFQTFDRSSYEGNPLLCGPPLEIRCSSFGTSPDPHSSSRDDDFRDAFLWSFAGSFVVAFFGVIAYLYFNYYFWIYNKRLCFPICW